MCFDWFGSATPDQGCNFGSLAVLAPLLQRMEVAQIIDQHLPPDPQAEYSHGHILRLLLGARLTNPVALCNVPQWAQTSGADILWNVPPEKLNDDRLGRALDAFYYQRHSILAHLALHVAEAFHISLDCLHYDPTHLLLHGDYANSQPRSSPAVDLQRPSAHDPPAHITYGHNVQNIKMIQAGVCAAVDDFGAVPLFGHTTDGNHNGHSAIAEQFTLLHEHLPLRKLLLVSDRGTFSAGHVARCQREGVAVLCSAPWKDYRALYDAHRHHLHWQRASYLSLEQQRRRTCASSLPLEHYQLAVLRHHLTDPDSGAAIPCRVLFVFSTADAKVAQATREKAVAKLTRGLQQLADSVQAGRRHTDPTSVARRVAKLFGKRSAAQYFHWELQALTDAEQATLPPPARGCRRPTHRFLYRFDAAGVQADSDYDGLSVLVTTAAQTESGDALFTQFKQQNELELSHHQWKTPLAVHPLFVKNPRRVEALVHLLLIALMAYHLLQRLYRQRLDLEATEKEKRTTTEALVRAFATYTLRLERRAYGRVVHTSQLSERQRQILHRLGFPTPAQVLSRQLPHPPPDE
jgi:transposase